MTKGRQDISIRHDLLLSVRMIGGKEIEVEARKLSNAQLREFIELHFSRLAA